MDVAALVTPVAELIRSVAAREILPRFGALRPEDRSVKDGWEPVTVADVAAERALFAGLGALVPEAVLVGEESVAADPTLLDVARDAPVAFVVDPIDGTANFIAGSPNFAVMVALLVDGEVAASWILHPVPDRIFTAVRDRGAAVDGVPLRRAPAPAAPAALRGVLRTWALGPEVGGRVWDRAIGLGELGEGLRAAGLEYPRVADGTVDYVFYWFAKVWDHAPGALLLREAGGVVAHLDGSAYTPWGTTEGLVLAADAATHRRVVTTLAPAGRP